MNRKLPQLIEALSVDLVVCNTNAAKSSSSYHFMDGFSFGDVRTAACNSNKMYRGRHRCHFASDMLAKKFLPFGDKCFRSFEIHSRVPLNGYLAFNCSIAG